MKTKKISFKNFYFGKLSYNCDLLNEINEYCNKNNILTGYISVLGALTKANLGFYDQENKIYQSFEITKPLEIVNCYGNISIKDGNPFTHIHLIASDSEGNCKAGHVMPGCKIFAGEIFIFEGQGEYLTRIFDKTTGLYLWNDDNFL